METFNFFNNLKSFLIIKNISMNELAEKSNISINTIHGWFSKNVYPSVEKAYKIATVLNVTVDYLITGEDKNNPENNLDILRKKYIDEKTIEFQKKLNRMI